MGTPQIGVHRIRFSFLESPMQFDVKKLYSYCHAKIGGDKNKDVQELLEAKKKSVTRQNFFEAGAFAILVSGVSRKGTDTVWELAKRDGFTFNDVHETAKWHQSKWDKFFAKRYPNGLSGRGGKKWQAIRHLAEQIDAFPDEESFRSHYFAGKKRGRDLDGEDVDRLYGMWLPFIRLANSQFIIRNMGGDAMKHDRWIMELLKCLNMTGEQLETELVNKGISLSLFDMVMWAYCEEFVKRTANLKKHLSSVVFV
jgi:hypothetical protein